MTYRGQKINAELYQSACAQYEFNSIKRSSIAKSNTVEIVLRVARCIFQSSCQQIFRDLLSAIQPWLKDWWWAWQMQLVLVAVSIWNPDSSIAVWVWNASKLPNDWACLINCILILKNSDRWTSQSLQLLTARLKDSSLGFWHIWIRELDLEL